MAEIDDPIYDDFARALALQPDGWLVAAGNIKIIAKRAAATRPDTSWRASFPERRRGFRPRAAPSGGNLRQHGALLPDSHFDPLFLGETVLDNLSSTA